jgi:hypothetical protein
MRSTRKSRSGLGTKAGLMLLVLLAACSQESRGTPVVAGDGAGRLPAESLRDWVSYADEVAVFTVASEQELQTPQEESARGEGLVGRTVELQVNKILWRRPGSQPAGDVLDVATYGWVLKDGEQISFAPSSGPRLEVGRTYVAPLVRFSDGEWGPQSDDSVVEVRDGSLVWTGRGQPSRPAASLTGKSTAEVAQQVSAARAYPAAIANAQLSAEDRAAVVNGASPAHPATSLTP